MGIFIQLYCFVSKYINLDSNHSYGFQMTFKLNANYYFQYLPILNSQCKEGARDVNNIWLTVVTNEMFYIWLISYRASIVRFSKKFKDHKNFQLWLSRHKTASKSRGYTNLVVKFKSFSGHRKIKIHVKGWYFYSLNGLRIFVMKIYC